MSKRNIRIIFGTSAFVLIMLFLKLIQFLNYERKNVKRNLEKYKSARIPIELINSRRWSSITHALQRLQGENGALDMASLRIVEDKKSLIIKFYTEDEI